MPINKMEPEQWIHHFEDAISTNNIPNIHQLLHHLPTFNDENDLKKVLLLTMEAEELICTLQTKLIRRRHHITSQYPSS